jgi:hypothetical protein
VDAEAARRLADVAAAVAEDAVDVLPLGARQAGRAVVALGWLERRRGAARERGEDLVGVGRLGLAVAMLP